MITEGFELADYACSSANAPQAKGSGEAADRLHGR